MASINLQSKDGGGDDSSRSPVRLGGVSSPWNKIVKGESGELSLPVVSVTAPTASPSSPSIQEHIANPSSDCYQPKAVAETENFPDDSGTECHSEGSGNGGGGSNASKKPVWSKPSNGVVEVVSPVMGAVSWPALGESTKPSPKKSSSSESLQALSDGPLLPALQVPGTGNPSPSSHKLAIANHVNPASTPNHVAAQSAQRSIRRGGGSSGAYTSSNGGFSQRSPAIQDPKIEAPRKPTMDSFPKDQRGGFGSQPNTNEHHHQRNSYRRGNNGGHGQHPRGNQEWNQHQHRSNFNNMQQQPQRGFRRGGYVRPSVHTSTPFMPPPQQMHVQMRPFGNGFMYPMADMASAMFYVQGPNPPDTLRPIPLVAPMQPPIYYPVQDLDLNKKILKQIEYYFSDENLVKDYFLRQNMDEQGWVPATLIAGFKKVSNLTDNVQQIIDVMMTSKDVEVKGDKMRSRNEWMKFVFPSTLNQDSLASQLRGIGLDDVATKNQAVV